MEKSNVNFFLDRYRKLGEIVSPSQKQAPALRMNSLRADPKKTAERLRDLGVQLRKIPFARHGYWITHSRFSLGASSEFLQGYYYIQEAAAQVPVEVLNPKPGERVLDG